MFRPLACLLGLTALIGVAPAAPVPKHLMPKDGPLYFPTRVGAKWVYSQGKEELEQRVTAAEQTEGGTLVTVNGESGGGTRWLVSRSGLSIVSMGKQKCDPPLPLLKLPLPPDRKWEVGAGVPSHPHPKGLFTAQGPAEVEVLAGKFRAIRVDVEWVGNNKVSFWFAPEVGLVKTAGSGFEKEMKSFTPAKG